MAIILALALVLWPAMAWPQVRLWTFSEVLKQSLADHPSVLARRSSAAAAQADYEAAEWQRYPTPTIEAVAADNTTGTTTRLRVQQPLWTGGRITAGIDATLSRKDASDFAITEAQQDVALRVAAAYVDALRQQMREEQGRRGVEEHQRLLELIGRRVQQEVSAPVDRELAQSRLYLAMTELSLNTQQRFSALAQLAQLAGRPVERVATLDAELPPPAPSEASALDAAITVSPTLRRIAAEERAASADVDSRRAVLWPQLGVRYERDFGGPFTPSDSRLLLVVEATPGAGLSAGSAIEAARSRQRSIEHTRAAAVRDLRERISIDWNELRYAGERLKSAELSRQTAATVFDSFTRQYTTGRKTWIDVMNSVREFTQAEFAVADAMGQHAAASLRLGILTGVIRPPAP